MKRLFKYHDQTWEDPGAEYTVEDVRRHLTTYFPELAQAKPQERKLEDGTLEITFVKQAGTKGGTMPPAGWGAGDVAARLLTVPPLELRAISLLAELDAGAIPVDRLIALQPELERAQLQLSEHVLRCGRATLLLAALPAMASQQVPEGF